MVVVEQLVVVLQHTVKAMLTLEAE